MSTEPNSAPKPRRLYWLLLLVPGIITGLLALIAHFASMPRGSSDIFIFLAMILALICGPTAAYMTAKQTKYRYENKALLAILLAPVFTVIAIALTIPGCAAIPMHFGPG